MPETNPTIPMVSIETGSRSGYNLDSEACEKCKRECCSEAWLTVVGSLLVYYSSFGIVNSFGFFQDYYTQYFLRDTPASAIAFCGTLQMFLMNSLAAVSGALCDRYGVRYLYFGSGTGTIFALIILSFIRPGHFWQVMLVQGLLMGLTMALSIQPALTVVGQHFTNRRALAMGVITTGSALGGIGFPLMFEKLLPVVGFANAMRLAALKIGICYTIAFFISRNKLSAQEGKRWCNSLIDFRGFLDLRYTLLCVGTFFAVLGLWMPSYYIKTYANVAYSNNTISEYFLCIINGTSIFGAILGGLMADHVGRLNLLCPITMLSGFMCLFMWLFSSSLAVLVLFASLYGLTISNINALPASVIGQVTPDGSLGARVGAFYSIVAIASLIGTPIGGALITDKEEKNGYRWLILFSGLALVVGSLFMIASRLLHDRHLRTWW